MDVWSPSIGRTVGLLVALAPAAALAQDLPGTATASSGWTADRAAARAVEVAPTVRQAEAARASAESTASIGVSAFAPRLDLSASYTRISATDPPSPELAQLGFEQFSPKLDNFGLRASVTVPVSDYFFTVLPSFRAAQHAARVAAFQAEAESEGVALRAKETFYMYVRAEAGERVATDAVAQLEAYVADLEVLVGAGEGTPADVLQARAQLAEARVQRAAARGGVRVAAEVLRQLLDLPPTTPIAISEDVFDKRLPPAPDPAALLSEALQGRPEVRALDALLDTAEAQTSAAKGGRLPQLRLMGNLRYANPNPSAILPDASFGTAWDLGVALTWSPNDFVANEVVIDQAQLERARVETDRVTIHDALSNGAAQAASDYAVALETISAADEGLSAAQEAWRVRRELLAVGETTSSEALNTETALRRAQVQRIDAHVAARLAQARVQHVMGKSRARGVE